MSAGGSRRLAWALAACTMLLLLASAALQLTAGVGLIATSDAFVWAIAIAFAAMGRLIASRQPGNAIGWLFLGAAVAAALGNLSSSYAGAWVDDPFGPALLGRTAGWYGSLSWIPWILAPSTFLLLLFPDGHLLSPRWRPVAWCAGLGMAGGFVTQGLAPGALEDYPHVTNPYGVHSALLSPLTGLSFLLMAVGVAGSSVSLIVRFRRAHGELRQQIKWLALAGAVAAVTFFAFLALYDVVGAGVANPAIMLGVLGLPLAAGVAILRYRLYDVDVVINRALVYGGLTATLGATYLGLVVLIGLAVGRSGFAVAASTLAVAALFGPARARIQAVVDRRFYRRRYDATQTLEAFGGRLRDELDLDAVQGELVGVIQQTVQPEHVTLWLPRNDSRTHGP
jgi:hypothetical protein